MYNTIIKNCAFFFLHSEYNTKLSNLRMVPTQYCTKNILGWSWEVNNNNIAPSNK